MQLSKFLTDFFTERVWVSILLVGLGLVVIAYYWLAIRAIKASKWWFVGLLPPFAVLYLLCFSRRVVAPVVLFLVGAAVMATPFVATRYLMPLLPRHPWESVVDEKLHVTLTGLTDFDYASLKSRPQIAVLQMANADVTDETLVNLAGLADLEELDISSSKITDDGLARLKSFPKLATLRLAHIATITDDGFKQHLLPMDQLSKLDVRETAIKGASLREWKNARPDRRSYLK